MNLIITKNIVSIPKLYNFYVEIHISPILGKLYCISALSISPSHFVNSFVSYQLQIKLNFPPAWKGNLLINNSKSSEVHISFPWYFLLQRKIRICDNVYKSIFIPSRQGANSKYSYLPDKGPIVNVHTFPTRGQQ